MQDSLDPETLKRAQQLFDEERFSEAAPLFRDLLCVAPQHVESLHRLAIIALHSKMPSQAARLLRQALRQGHESAEILNDLGTAFIETGDMNNAERCFRRAMAHFPSSPLGHASLAFIEHERGDFERAEQLYLDAITAAPDDLEASFSLATLYRERGRPEEAVELLDALSRRVPHEHQIRNQRSHSLLQQKQWKRGWEDYESRLVTEKSQRFHMPPGNRWNGEPLSGKHLLVVPEQGIGDEILFASCYQDIIDRAGHCTIVCAPRLESTFSCSFPSGSFIPLENDPDSPWLARASGTFDYCVPAGSLPRHFRNRSEDFPRTPYLLVPSSLRGDRFKKPAEERGRVRVGISWYGGALVKQAERRAIPFDTFKQIFRTPGVEFVNLQHGCCDEEAANGELSDFKNVTTYTDINPYQQLDPWFALIASLDLLISVDNSNVHFAGAMGVPTWLLLSDCPDWRWPTRDESSLWYPSVSFIRKDRERGWDGLMKDVARRLRPFATAQQGLRVAS